MKTANMMKTTILVAAMASMVGTVYATKSYLNENDGLAATSAKVSPAEAVKMAEANGAKAISIRFEQEKDQAAYEIELLDQGKVQEVLIDANTGKALSSKDDDEGDEKADPADQAEIDAFGAVQINLQQALETAASQSSGQALGGEFSAENGKAVYELEVAKSGEVLDLVMDANSGEVLSMQADQPDQKKAESDDDGDHGQKEGDEQDEEKDSD